MMGPPQQDGKASSLGLDHSVQHSWLAESEQFSEMCYHRLATPSLEPEHEICNKCYS